MARLKYMIKIADAEKNEKLSLLVEETKNKFKKSMDDDLNMPLALSYLFDMMNVFNRSMDKKKADKALMRIMVSVYRDVYSEFQKALEAGKLTLNNPVFLCAITSIYELVLSVRHAHDNN